MNNEEYARKLHEPKKLPKLIANTQFKTLKQNCDNSIYDFSQYYVFSQIKKLICFLFIVFFTI